MPPRDRRGVLCGGLRREPRRAPAARQVSACLTAPTSRRLEPLGNAQRMITGVRRVLATAIGAGITTEERAAALLSRFAGDAMRFPERATLWPLMIGAWKRKPAAAESEPTR